LSSVLKALKKAEKEKAQDSAPFIHSFLKRSEKKKLSYNFIRSGLFGVLILSFLCSILYLYNFNNKKVGKTKQIDASIYFAQKNSGKKSTEFPNKSDIKKTSDSQNYSINQTQATKQESSPVETNTEKKNEPELLPEPEPEPAFKPEPANAVLTEKASKPEIELNMISWMHDPNERIAIINDSPMKEGEVKDGIKVLKINIKNVHIWHNNVEKVIKFKKS